jgi:hypothetical protein
LKKKLQIQIVLAFALVAPAVVLAQIDATIPLRVPPPFVPPAPRNVFDLANQVEQIRLMQAQRQNLEAETQRLRQQMQVQQTEAKMRELEQQRRRNDEAAREAARKAAAAASAPTGPTSTGFLVNGRLWQHSPDAQRYAFIVGFMQALLVEKPEGGPRYFARTLTMEELNKAISDFYVPQENLAVPVTMALEIVRMKANGDAPQDIEEQTAIARRVAVQFIQTQ